MELFSSLGLFPKLYYTTFSKPLKLTRISKPVNLKHVYIKIANVLIEKEVENKSARRLSINREGSVAVGNSILGPPLEGGITHLLGNYWSDGVGFKLDRE